MWFITAGMIVLLVAAAVSDLLQREVHLVILAALAVMSLLGRPLPWWVATAAACLTPRRWAVYATPLPVLAGVFTGDGAPAIALAAGLLAWYLHWWGGADGILLAALALRYGPVGLWAAAIALAAGGLAVLALRRRSPAAVLGTALELLTGHVAADDENVPGQSELPAAAFLAGAGIVLEVARAWTQT